VVLFSCVVGASSCGDGEELPLELGVGSILPDAGERHSAGAGGDPSDHGLGGSGGEPGQGGVSGQSVSGAAGEGGAQEWTPSGGGSTSESPTSRCFEDADCQDGLYCNGVERCKSDFGASDVKSCTHPEYGPCGRNACDERNDACDCSNPDFDDDTVLIAGCATGGLVDCDDNDTNRFPGNVETCDAADPEHDEDCKDESYAGPDDDGDKDGYYPSHCANAHYYQPVELAISQKHRTNQGNDCDDTRNDVHPEAEETCDGVDNDCNGVVDEVFGAPKGDINTFFRDEDGDSWGNSDDPLQTLCDTAPDKYAVLDGDCRDHDPLVAPGRGEACNGFDDDCDGTIDQPLRSGGLLFDEPYDGGLTEFECMGETGWKVKTCPTGRLDCGDENVLDGCETPGTSLCNCHACGEVCSFSCGESSCEEIQSLSLGNLHTCALVVPANGTAPTGGKVACWGRNAAGELGNETTKDSVAPVQVADLLGVTTIAAGERHGCAIASGKLSCWGSNEFGQLGSGGPQALMPYPVAVELLDFTEAAVRVTSGSFHSCAIYDAGHLACWGRGDLGQLGDGNEGDGYLSHIPSRVQREVDGEAEYILDASQVAAGFQHTCALSSGRVECWGSNNAGQLGVAPSALLGSRIALPVPGLETTELDELVAAGFHTCARAGANVLCWGSNFDQELASDNGNVGLPTPVELPAAAVSIAAGQFFACALTQGGAIYCWGTNTYGERGGSGSPAVAPTLVPLEPATGLFGGNGHHVCATTAQGAWCWGRNDFGQLGTGNTAPAPGPARVIPLGGLQTCTQ
jgi:hypothetical protein